MASPTTRSLSVVADEVKTERQMQLSHFDSLDSKAGIVLGFAGALVALSRGGHEALVEVGRGAATMSGLLALLAFWPRRYWHVDLRALRDIYLGAEPVFTRLRLLDTEIGMAGDMKHAIASKAFRLKLAMATLATAVVLTAAGLALR